MKNRLAKPLAFTKFDFQQIFHSYAATTSRINLKYELQFERVADQGIAILEQMCENYVDTKKSKPDSNVQGPMFGRDQQEKTVAVMQSQKKKVGFKISPILVKKHVDQDDDIENIMTTPKAVKFASKKKSRSKSDVVQMEDDELTKQFRQFSFSSKKVREPIQRSDLQSNEDLMADCEVEKEFQEIGKREGKSLFELVQESNSQIKKSAMKNKQNSFNYFNLLSERDVQEDELQIDCEYQMTDYSSNESSNDQDYRQEFRDVESDVMDLPMKTHLESEKPLFSSSFFKKNLEKVETPQSSLNSTNSLTFVPYKDRSLMKSAKKSKKTKRLFIRNKRIPKWGQDMEKVKKATMKQIKMAKEGEVNPREPFGNICVEQLESNKVFNLHEVYKRHSSAKWKNKSLFVS